MLQTFPPPFSTKFKGSNYSRIFSERVGMLFMAPVTKIRKEASFLTASAPLATIEVIA